MLIIIGKVPTITTIGEMEFRATSFAVMEFLLEDL